MKLPSSSGNWVRGCGGPLGAGGCGRGPGPAPCVGALVCTPGPFACGPGAAGSGPCPGPLCMGLACCVAAGLLQDIALYILFYVMHSSIMYVMQYMHAV